MSMFALFLVLAFSSSVSAAPLGPAASLVRIEDRQEDGTREDDGAEGHLSHSWVVAVAVSLVVIILALTVTVLIVKLRQRRKRRVNTSRRRRNYSRTSDELVAAREQQPYEHVWRGPYTSRASYTRSPSPPSPAHLSEKDKWAQPQR